MDVTKQLEEEILNAYYGYWDAYLAGDMEAFASYLDDDCHIIGSTAHDTFDNKKEAISFYTNTANQVAGKCQYRNRNIVLLPMHPQIMVQELSEFYFLDNEEWHFYGNCRLSTLFSKKNGSWKIVHQHGSLPDARADEGQQLGTEKITRENLQLKEAIKRNTIELRQKNRELEIETSLEKVRAVAMGMHQPNDMLAVCKVLYHELLSLGFDELRNSLINIYDDGQQDFTNFDYSDIQAGTVTCIPYRGNPVIEQFISDIRKDKSAFSELKVAGEQLQEWKAFRKSNNEADDPRLENAQVLYYYNYSVGEGSIGISTFSSINQEKQHILERLRHVFDLAYKRYIDISNAEAQAREAQVQTALERVRAQAMAMRTPEDLTGICEVLYREMVKLGFTDIRNAMINIHDDEKSSFVNYDYSDEIGRSINHLVYNIHPLIEKQVIEIRSSGDALSETCFAGKDLEDMKAFRKRIGEKDDPRIDEADALYYYFYSIGTGAIGISTFKVLKEEKLNTLKRFRNVFSLSYQRYADIAQAETQAREAQIEAALERVRSRSMAMQKSDELQEVIKVVFEQFGHLKINIDHAGFVVDYTPKADWHFWIADHQVIPSKITHPYFESIWAHQFDEAKAKGDDFFATNLNFEEKNEFYEKLLSYVPGLPKASRDFYFNAPGLSISTVLLEDVSLYIENFSFIPYTEEENKILLRFGKVFQQTYTRFLDLQKAEAQTREAQIEIAFERVRARAMAMYTSNELHEVALELRQQMGLLGQEALEVCAVLLFEENEDYFESWGAARIPGSTGKIVQGKVLFPNKGIRIVDEMMQLYKSETNDYILELEGEKGWEWLETLKKYAPEAYTEILPVIDRFETDLKKVYWSLSDFSGGSLMMVSYAYPDENSRNLLQRSARVFDLAYRRYKDLKKAEEQAREEQIQLALERVRSRTMAMQKSEDLFDVISEVKAQMHQLNFRFDSADFMTDYSGKGYNIWLASDRQSFSQPIYISYNNSKMSRILEESMQRGDSFFPITLNQEEKNEHFNHVFENTLPENVTDETRQYVLSAPGLAISCFAVKNIILSICNFAGIPYSDAENEIIKRFGNVFEQSYTRFLDLQKAEARAREKEIELALERVRARTMAMQKSSELSDAANLLFYQIQSLGMPAWSTGYCLWPADNKDSVTLYMSSEGVLQPPFVAPTNEDYLFGEMRRGAETNKELHVVELAGDALVQHYQYMRTLPVVGQILDSIIEAGHPLPVYQIMHQAYFRGGFLLFITYEPVPKAHDIFKRFGKVFEQTYIRFLDLQKVEAQARQAEMDLISIKEARQKAELALNELKATQKQLIQSEKMASLGELTAGIAHEIQNPLNFVNNFSDVSSELIEEMTEELDRGDIEEAKAIAHDIRQNLEKINTHGKRADSIVKGMLQHSRTSTGQKEPTDINALCDEYLRLAYHGLRAKDKSFNATLQTQFDDDIGKINIISQDIGRVILNLINNAFYAVEEKMKSGISNYEPTVSVITKKVGNNVEIAVRDNGNGIPEAIVDKIFQPFFTTKPTGQGTGLGLSLSYDIVKAHNGELKVETKKSEGSVFSIFLRT